jgi:hypothetical protein
VLPRVGLKAKGGINANGKCMSMGGYQDSRDIFCEAQIGCLVDDILWAKDDDPLPNSVLHTNYLPSS